MPVFLYKGRNKRGEAVRGHIEAVSPDAVATQLFNSGITPIDIALPRAGADVLAALRAWVESSGKVQLVDLILFSRQMYTMMKAGVPIMQALRGLRESTRNLAVAKVITSIGESLDTGLDLASALKRHPRVFSQLYVSMVQVGETTGSLQEVFEQLALYLEREKDTRDRIKSATRYPVFVVVAMAVAMFIINLFVIPAFAKVYAGFRIELPWATKLLIATSNFTVAYWHLMLAAVVLGVIALRFYVNTAEGRYRWHKIKLKLPVVGKILYQATLGRFARAMAVMIKSGVPLVQGMTVISRAVDNDYIGERVVQMRDGIERGETIARTAATTAMFPPLVIQMISVGEETGAVDELMFNVADYYEREVDYDIKNLSDAIQPLLIIVLGVLVLILALGVFLPMWDLVQVARKG
ncbi:MAG: MSHA biogenesis protein MshG [Candidatus Muproteobacteria bacterium RIFCSPHIGHO2_02_FULL_65_16]|uniref:MSHA biogenesis protein MshG n=1 Tax=Candidatus Muproteobacteria bacterium RIFCSPHIGHO2_02_FULL_65_16 TaxID=1817766 RepID=A0A1F6U1J2_9PROT|nr:MAG: MSHA biogenesis protein MshG [Candidatus Muproteobacteria bacterium RIFCSPHIGHO2_02_FULL_65_16]